jgi:hypothetical protein
MAHHLTPEHITPEMEECIVRCTECHNTCLETVTHCLTIGGEHAAVEHIRLLLDCVSVCAASRDFMLRGSDFHPRICGVCADVCQRYADWSEGIPGLDEQMRACADECRRCADSCRAMASHT